MDALRQQIVFGGASLVCAGICAVHDLREGRIPNRLTGTAIVAGLMMHGVAGGPRELAFSALAGLAAGAIFLVFFLAGGMGAGDVKLMAAVGCISGLSQLGLVLVATALAGGVLAIGVGLYHGRLQETLGNASALLRHHGRNGLRPHPDLNLANARTLRLPFAVPVAAGCLFALCALALEAHL